MANLVNQLDALKNALDGEAVLRKLANVEFANGNQNGPFKVAHDASVRQCLDAATVLIRANTSG